MLFSTRPLGQAAEWRSKNQPQDRSGLKYPYYQGMPLPCPNHAAAGPRKSGSTGSREAQSQCRHYIESRGPPYVESLKELGDATLGHRTGEGSG
jgi:hypothetical protein